MKITQFVCDFNENLKQHPAVLRVIVEGGNDELRKDVDACGNHVLQLITSTFLNNTHARTCVVSKLDGTKTVDVAAPKEKVTYEKQACGIDGCNRMLAPQGRKKHMERYHPNHVLAV